MKLNDLVTLDVESLAYGGEGVGRIQKKVVFVPLSAPGDRIDVLISEAKKNYLRGNIERFETLSQVRTVPLCNYFGECGGCQWQHLRYDYQLQAKEQIVKGSIERISKIHDYELLPILPSPRFYEYRARVRIQCLTHRTYKLGFFRANTNEIVPIEKCDLLPQFTNRIFRKLNEFLNSTEYLIVFNDIELMANSETEEAIISLSADAFSKDQIISFLKSLKHSIPNIYGIAIHTGQEPEIRTEYFGNCSLEFSEKIFPETRKDPISLTRRIHIDTFSQVNLEQNSNLIRTIYDWIEPSGSETVVDLFCGMGNLCIPLAHNVRRVIGIEDNAHSVEDARYNAASNHTGNCEFRNSDVLIGLEELRKEGVTIDVLLLDPPRKGCKALIPAIAECKPSKVIYVSCNPTTLARDIGLFDSYNYRLKRVQPIDMFPQTYHVETIAELMPG